jgi:hypothetical protein
MEENEELLIMFDPSEDKVLGVINDNVHVQVPDYLNEDVESYLVLIIPFKEYKRVWTNWLKGKQDYCERWKEYCGVMGTTVAKKFIKQDFQTDLNIWNPIKEDYEVVMCDTYFVSKFEDHHDFEHG